MSAGTTARRGSGGARRGKQGGRGPRSAESSDSRIAAARESFAAAVGQLRSETRFRAWLEAQRRLRRYSPRNVLWILFQKPEATHVASYETWRNELGYQVRRGEQSIKVWAPGHRKKDERDVEAGEE
ncbi:MAG TPA: ArdC family protein, partial [Solirubrobacterales bacterium]|nr:ArdC family protein [Solirubrobacterales bacterium]